MGRKRIFPGFLTALLCLAMFSTSCSGNIFSKVVNTSGYSDQANYTSMLINMNDAKWTDAVANYKSMSTSYQSQRYVQNLYAQALAGACGFSFADFFLQISTIFNISTTTPLFYNLMHAYKSTTITMMESSSLADTAASSTSDTYCANAQAVMDGIYTTYGSWSDDEKLFDLIFSLARIGINLRYWMDPSQTGAVASTQDICSKSSIPDYYMTQVVTGFALLYNILVVQTLTAVSSSSGNSGTTASALTTFCNSITTYATLAGFSNLNICAATTPALVTSDDIKFMRDLLSLQGSITATNWTSFSNYGLYPATTPATAGAASDPTATASWQCNATGTLGPFSCCP